MSDSKADRDDTRGVTVDSCGAAAIAYLPDGRQMTTRELAWRVLEIEAAIREPEELKRDLVYANQTIERLRAAIRDAPHNMGCHSIQPEFTHIPQWGTLEYCDCWKREAMK